LPIILTLFGWSQVAFPDVVKADNKCAEAKSILECGGLTPLSFFAFSRAAKPKTEKKKKAALHRRTPNLGGRLNPPTP